MSDMSEDGDSPSGQTGIQDLPPEVLSHIFSFLTVADLQEARLVCYQWYEVSQTPFLLEREKVVACANYGCTNPDVLLESTRDFLNLSLMDVRTAAWYSDDFWTKFGLKLRSLSLCYCNIKEDEILRVLSHCERLTSLEIMECEYLFSFGPNIGYAAINNSAPRLFHLQSLKIANTDALYPRLFDKLVDCAPNLASLSLDDCLAANTSEKDGERPLTYMHIVKYLREKPHKISSLYITCCEDDEAFMTAVTLPNLRLKIIHTDYSKVEAVLRCQTSLQDIDLSCIATDTLLQTICSTLPGLKRLTLQFCSAVTCLGTAALPMLKNLTSLKLFQCCNVSGEAILKSLCQSVNTTMRELSLTDLDLVSHLDVVVLAKSHPSLTHFNLSGCVGITDWSVQAIFKYQRTLQTLELRHCHNLTDFGLSGKKITYSKNVLLGTSLVCKLLKYLKCCDVYGNVNPTGHAISELKNLQRLNLDSCSLNGTAFVKGVKLPALRHLILDNTEISGRGFKCLCANNVTIEKLELSNCCGVTDELIPVILKKLKRLKNIDLEDCNSVTEQSIINLRLQIRKVKD